MTTRPYRFTGVRRRHFGTFAKAHPLGEIGGVLGIGGGTPYYVVRLDAERNRVIVGFKADAIRYDFELSDTVGTIDKSLPVKVRSAGEPRLLKEGIAGVAPGQSAVFYDGDEVVGGGIIMV